MGQESLSPDPIFSAYLVYGTDSVEGSLIIFNQCDRGRRNYGGLTTGGDPSVKDLLSQYPPINVLREKKRFYIAFPSATPML
jgi:hypothetical protein